MTFTPFRLALTATALATVACVAHAQQAGLSAAAQKAISTNPEVTARYNALRAASNEQDVARGGFLPQVNLGAEVGRNRDKIDARNPESQNSSRTGLSLSVNQMLWDGQATRKEVERLGHARMTRYFEFVSATEDAALEASRAYVDVARYRRLVELAEDNYVQHKYVFDQLQSKVKAGVGRGVDSEQTNARLSLAESNLTTEIANLHDVSARYLRVVGEPPEAKMASPREPLARNAFKSNADATVQAMARNSAVTAAIENVRAAEAQAQSRDGAFQPKVEARLRTGAGHNFDGQSGQRNDTLGQIVLNWNLYNGGSDKARVRQFADLLNQAQDLRDKACRDVRQTAAIAQNDIGKLKDQLAALDRNVLSIEKARDAYRQQFDIGQRSLLDLLNAENELYTAKRAYANAEHDLMLAQARTLAVTNTLVSSLGLSRTDDGSADLAANWQAAEDAAQRCPNVIVTAQSTPREELDARAKRMAGPAAAAPVPAPAPAAAEPMATPANVKTVEDRLRDWVATWMAKDINKYFTFYAKEFAPARYTSAKWIAERRRLVTKPGDIDIKVSDVKASAQGPYVVTSFKQTYNSKDFKDVSQKTLTWRYVDNDWIIFKESNR